MRKGLFIVLFFLPVCAMTIMSAQTKPAQTKPKAGAVSKKTMEAGKKVYDLYCLACHQEDGNGVPRMNPPLIKTSFVLGEKKKLVQILLKGMDEQVEINGQTYSNVMASHNFLTDQEIADVLSFVRNSFGNKASGVTATEVKTIRAQTK
jgi:mono/diheme cytochrome c family protein